MGIPFICVGDKTSGGGVVVTGSQFDTIDGRAMARVGDKATCTKKNHPHTVTIVTTKDPTMITNGSPQAFHGDQLSCGCTLISSQVATNSDPTTTPPRTISFASSAPQTVTVDTQQEPNENEQADNYDQHFELRDEHSREVLKNRYYKIHYSSRVVEGHTDKLGLTKKVSGDPGEAIKIEIFAEAA